VVVQDTVPVTPRTGDFINDKSKNPFELKDPKSVDQTVEFDPKTGRYLITEKLANEYYRMPTYMTYAEYLEYRKKKQQQEFFKKLAGASTANKSSGGKEDPIALIPIDEETILDRLFGGTEVDIRPQGTINLTFGGDYQVVKNPTLTLRQQRQGGFDFDMDIQMNVTGKIGEKLNLSTNYNTQATFDFDNQMKLDYNTANFSEDEILRKIEAGNVSFPLPTQLISGPSSLFGLATELQFGALTIGAVASQQKSQRKQLQIQGGSQLQEFDVNSDQYDENRHFFLSHFNRNSFEPALQNLPQVNSLFRITRSEVWITNDRNITEGVRDIVAIADLGESERFTSNNSALQQPNGPVARDIYGNSILPDNDANGIYQALINNNNVRNLDGAVQTLESSQFGFQQTKDFEKVRARLLNPNEYFIDPQLGYISVNVNLRPDQVLAVSYEYTYNGENHKVGEFSNDAPIGSDTLSVLFTKLMKSTTQRIDLPTWDLMMKNIYNIGAYQVDPKDFRLDVYYEDPGAGLKRFLPETDLASIPLVRLFNLDNLNIQGDPQPDGIFDFVQGLTINTSNGRIMFPVLEPFGSSLKNRINNPILAEKYSYQQLYDSTLIKAREFPELNRFTIKGSYKSSITSEISLGGFNIPEGSVRVTSGAQQMIEDVDYQINYGTGQLTILNDALLNSGVPINVSFEDNALFGLNQRTMVGVRADYKVNEHLNIGGTFMQLFERPFTQKVNIGEDPINNKIYGLDVNYSNDAPWLTRLVDKIPLIDTKEPSSINFSAEAAFLKPGHAKAINQGDDQGGTVNLDDFEGTVSNIDLRQPTTQWTLASIPQRLGLDNKFPEGEFINNTISGVNRAHLSWYRIDGGARGSSRDSAAYNRAIPVQEVFPNRNVAQNQSSVLQTLDLTYYPEERGPYNFDLPNGGTAYSAGVLSDGRLRAPETRWAGIMRAIRNTDFQQQNIEFVEFWMLDPFLRQDDGTVSQGGKLFMNIGSISEDILRDSRRVFENGLPDPNASIKTPTDETEWGIIPRVPAINANFPNDPQVRAAMDIGFDGLDSEGEALKFADFLVASASGAMPLGPAALAALQADPSSDNFKFFRDPMYDDSFSVIDKYKYNFNPEGNSTDQGASSNQNPDSEDLNRDNTLNESEAYYEYEIPITPAAGGGLELNDFVVDQVSSLQNNPNGPERTWYKFRVPIDQYTSKVGGIQDFRAMRFIRLYMTDFQERVTLRFARFDLVRNQWRVYNRDLKTPGIFTQTDNEGATTFDVSAINIEENASKRPFNYVLPVGILREQSIGAFPNVLQNEQSLQLNVCNLGDGDARGVFKNNINLDMRVFERLKMFVHAESQEDIQEGEVSMFIRLGSDFQENFYEYEVPLTMSDKSILPPNVDNGEAPEPYRRAVWLDENELDFALDLFPQIKIERNKAGASKNSFWEIPDPEKPENTVRVIGNPNLGFVKSMLVGIRNTLDDGTEKCFEVWINELRLSGLDERGGAAAIARMDMQLADFADVSVSANYSTIGFGQLEEKVNERAREESIQFDVAANLQLDKFLNPNWGLKIPFHWQISRDIKNPEYDPYDLDINFKEKINEAPVEQRDSIRDQAQDVTNITSYNFTNVRKERVNSQRTPKPWDIENFSFSYAFTETDSHDPIIESDNAKQYRGSVDYGFNTQPKYIQPFKGLVKESKALKWLGAFNFNPIPNSFGVSGAVDRLYAETKYRFTEPQFSTFYNKRFAWDRNYDLQWDLSKSLKLSFNAANNSVIDEDPGAIAEGEGTGIQQAFSNLGRNKNYHQNINVNYTLPFKQIPILDFASGKAQLASTYGWSAAALNVDSLGNVIQNTQTRQLSGDLNFQKLYKKVGYLDRILKKPRPSNSRNATADKKEAATKEKKTKKSKKDKKKKGEEEELTEEEAKAAATKAKDEKKAADKKKEEKKTSEPSSIERVLIRPLLLLDKARITYSESYANIVPGFLPRAQLFGQSGGLSAPGFGFALGEAATTDWLDQAAGNGWITSSPFLSQEVVRNKTENLDLKLTLEPFSDFRVDVEWNRSFTENHLELFKRKNVQSLTFDHGGARDVGSYDISFAAFKTIFDKDINQVFADFEEARTTISQRLGSGVHPDDGPGFSENYGRTQLDVLIPAFVAAYSGQDAATIGLDVFKYKPRPNWRLTYNGLTKIPFFKKVFTNFSLTHGYRSNMQLSSYNTELEYLDSNGKRDSNPTTNSYYSRFEIPNVVISEQFLPLIGLDIRLKNNMSFKLDYKKSRNLSMSFVDYQLAESKTTDFVFNFGYRLKNIDIPFFTQFGNPDRKKKTKKKKKKDTPKETTGGNDLNFAFDISIRDDITVNHLLDQDTPPIPTRGSKTISIQPSVDYNVSEQLNLRLFVDYRKTNPATSASFPITNTSGGIQVRFSL